MLYTLKELKYLIHGGRISHMKGLLASVLNIKPIIGVEKVRGTYVNLGQARSFANAVKGAVSISAGVEQGTEPCARRLCTPPTRRAHSDWRRRSPRASRWIGCRCGTSRWCLART